MRAQEVLSTRRQATRAELEQMVQRTEELAQAADQKTKERLETMMMALRQRLRNGDFAPGDRLMLTVLGDSSLSDTFTVQPDQRITLPQLPQISLRGVLDSELSEHLSKELAKYLKNPQVTAKGLLRLQVSGAIGRPGFLTVPVDQLVSDVLMAAGGVSQQALLDKSYVRRGDDKLLDRKQFSEALRQGRTVGDISLRDGDEIVVAAQTATNNLQKWIPIVTTSLTIFWLITRGRRVNAGGGRVP
jgi:polysaccharide export outer membrane protein